MSSRTNSLKFVKAAPQEPVYAVIQWRYANIRIRDGFLYSGNANPSSSIAAPSAAATTANTTAASSLPIGTYFLKYTWVLNGETTPGPEATFTTTTGQLATATIPISPAGVTLANIYLTPTNGISNSETLYLQNVTVSPSATTAVPLQEAYIANSVVPPVANTTASYAAGVGTMALSNVQVILTTGLQFTVAGDSRIYRILSHTETSGVTTSITFSPVLQRITYYNTAITFGPHIILVKVGEGNLTYSEKRPMMYIKDRGTLDTVKFGDDEPVELRLETQWQFITAVSGSGTPSIEDALKNIGEASTWQSSSPDACEPYAVDLEIEYVPPCPGVQREIISFPTFRAEDFGHDVKAATISISGKCNVTRPVVTRSA